MQLAVCLAVLTVCVVYGIISARSKKVLVPQALPWLETNPGQWFAETRAALKLTKDTTAHLARASEKYLEKSKSYIFPNLLSQPDIIIPIEQLRWLLDFPDHQASVGAAHFEILHGDYAFSSPQLLRDLFHEHVVHRHLPRRLASLIPGTWHEIQYIVDKTFGHDTDDWHEIDVTKNMMAIVSSLSNRMFVGVPLCRNEEFLTLLQSFTNTVMWTIVTLSLAPGILKPVFGNLAALRNKYNFYRIKKIILPVIEKRVDDIEHNENHPENPIDVPDDYFTWHIREAKSENRQREQQPEWVARYLMPAEFAAIHTTTVTIVNTLLDLLGSDPKERFVEQLREEAVKVFDEAGGVWTKNALNRLHRADSAIRESMRVSAFSTISLRRKVVAKDGIQNQAEGWTAPEGSYISIDAWTRQHDPDIFPDPNTYDAFRFSRPREEYEHAKANAVNSNGYLQVRNLSLTTTSDTFLPWGHGRHACPGRFFVNHELKMLLAYILFNYDLQYLPVRPPNKWMGGTNMPPADAKIRIRRRVKG